MRHVIQSLGLPEHQYASHSFRIGTVTSAVLAGVEDSTIQALGTRWSAAFLQYVRLTQEPSSRHLKQILSSSPPRLSTQPFPAGNIPMLNPIHCIHPTHIHGHTHSHTFSHLMYYVLLILILNSLGLGGPYTLHLPIGTLNPYNPILLGGYAPPKHTHGRGTLSHVCRVCVMHACT